MNYTPHVDRQGGDRLPVSPDRWGPVFWDTMHYVTLGYPATDPAPQIRRAAFEFMQALPFLLPCSICREHLAEAYLMDMPLEKRVFESRQAFGEYVVRLRDLVKQKHVCPGCDLQPHFFPQDVAVRLLSRPPPPIFANKWLLIVPPLLFLIYRYSCPPHGKLGVSKPTSFASSRPRF